MLAPLSEGWPAAVRIGSVWFKVRSPMIDDELRTFGQAEADRSLDGLESDVWRKLAERGQIREAARRRASLQGIVMIVAFVGSVAIGINSAQSPVPAKGRSSLTLGLELTPSSLLLGDAR